MSNGYFSIPRSLIENELWEKLSAKAQLLFIYILNNVCFKPQKFDDFGVIFELQPGQICTTIREMEGWFNKKFSKNDIERSIKKLILCDFLRQEVRHRKSILTISHKETYELICRASETRSETNLRQTRDKLETEKNNDNNEKKENIYDPKILPFDSNETQDAVNQDFDPPKHNCNDQTYYQTQPKQSTQTRMRIGPNRKKFSKQETTKKIIRCTNSQSDEFPSASVSTTEEEHQRLLLIYKDPDFVQACYEHLNGWKESKAQTNYLELDKHTDFGRITHWVAKAVKKSMLEEKEIKAREAKFISSSTSQSNADYSKEIFKKYSLFVKQKGFTLHVGPDYLEFAPDGGNAQSKTFKFIDKEFKINAENFLTQLGVKLFL